MFFSERCPQLTTFAVVSTIVAITAPLLLFAELQTFAPTHKFLRDPLAVAQEDPAICCRPYFGMISLIGSLIWATAAAVCLLIWLIARRVNNEGIPQTFFFWGFLFTTILCLDDTFQLHETVIPQLGFQEYWGVCLLAVFAIPYLISARFVLYRRSGLMLVAALTFLGLSLGLDQTIHVSSMTEDGLKFIGIVTWAVFHFSLAIEEFHRFHDRIRL